MKEIKEKMLSIYKDWTKTKNIFEVKDIKNKLKESSKSGLNFTKVLKEMNADGDQLCELFSKNWQVFGSDPYKAKKNFMKLLYKETSSVIREENEKSHEINIKQDGSVVKVIDQSYYPATDRSKSMLSKLCPSERDLVIQIRHALVAGNFQIADQLIKSGWATLSLKDRNGLIEFVNSMNSYNPDEIEVPKSRTTFVLKPIEKKSDLTKDEFAERLLRTAKEHSVIY